MQVELQRVAVCVKTAMGNGLVCVCVCVSVCVLVCVLVCRVCRLYDAGAVGLLQGPRPVHFFFPIEFQFD